MPIKPENKAKYPPNWREIRRLILTRAKGRCEHCGVPDKEVVHRSKQYPLGYVILDGTEIDAAEMDGIKTTYIVLTVAHLDQDPTNNDPANLAALCQKCHFAHDRPFNLAKAKKTRAQKAGQKELNL